MSTTTPRRDQTLWIQCVCTALVAVGAACVSYRHGQQFAARFGADTISAAIWPLLVDGLLTMATVELWKSSDGRGRSAWAAWLAFTFGICLSLCANIAAAPLLTPLSVAVAACPPLALLLAAELLNRALKRQRASTSAPAEPDAVAAHVTVAPAVPTCDLSVEIRPPNAKTTAKQRMWAYYQAERRSGRTPTGADLDRIAGTNNYGRRLLRIWQTSSDGSENAGV